MQGREAEVEGSCRTTVAETGREHEDGRLRKKVSMWTVLQTFSFVFWLNLFNIYDWPHQDSLGSNPPAIPTLLLEVAEVGPHASSSRPRPSLWPPALMFLPSTSADRVSFMPGIKTLTPLFLISSPDWETSNRVRSNRGPYQDAGSECIQFPPNLHCSLWPAEEWRVLFVN